MRIAGVDLSLWVVLTTLAVLACALVLGHLSEVGYRRAAEKRGLVLLKQWLSPAQLAQYEKGQRQALSHPAHPPDDELNERGVRTVSYCFGPEGELPIGDVMLAQKIALENNEQAALALANRGNPHQSPPRFG